METDRSVKKPKEHLEKFYKTFGEIKANKYDGMIITGAPIEDIEYEEVYYWNELTDLMEWTKHNVLSTIHICWGALAGVYHHHNISKRYFSKKLFGVFKEQVKNNDYLLFKGANDIIYLPHSRYATWNDIEIRNNENLKIVLEDNNGISMVVSQNAKQIFIVGHFEYDADTLQKEYNRDVL
jgi:homoserine O-succinyltransferase